MSPPRPLPPVHLHERPEFFPLVAQWIWSEWRHLLTQQTLGEFEHWLRQGRDGRGLPATLLWMEDGSPLATVSLECDDMEIRPESSPWLASLYVLPAHRRRGIGRALVRAAEAEARMQGVRELYLFTPDHEPFYAALGWERMEQCEYRSTAVTIMKRAL